MSKALELRQKAATALDAWKSALEARDKASSPEERTAKTTEVDDKQKAYEAIQTELRQQEAIEAAEKAQADDTQKRSGRQNPGENLTPEQKISKRFSLVKAIRSAATKKPLDGAELEMYQEADREAREANVSLTGDIRVPSFIMEQRDITATGSSGAEGGYTIPTDLGELIPVLRPRLTLEDMGATVLTGLSGNLDIPRQITASAAAWEGENTAADETNTTFDKLQLSPKRLAAFMDVSKRLMMQSSLSIENFVRNDLNKAQRQALEVAFINGATGGNNPVGILNTTGIGSVAIDTNGGAPTWAHMIKLWKELAVDNADMNTMGFLTTPGVAAQLMQTEKATGTAQFVWSTNSSDGQVNGYRARASNNVPSTLTKGSSSGICHAVLFGDFSNLIIGSWAGLDLTVDPLTRAKEAIVVVTVNSYWDAVVRHPEGFSAIKDALVTI